MKVSEAMTSETILVEPDDTTQQAAQLLGQHDCGILTVSEGDKMIGMITDRDISVRCVATARDWIARSARS